MEAITMVVIIISQIKKRCKYEVLRSSLQSWTKCLLTSSVLSYIFLTFCPLLKTHDLPLYFSFNLTPPVSSSLCFSQLILSPYSTLSFFFYPSLLTSYSALLFTSFFSPLLAFCLLVLLLSSSLLSLLVPLVSDSLFGVFLPSSYGPLLLLFFIVCFYKSTTHTLLLLLHDGERV